jgi:hypothetical protein
MLDGFVQSRSGKSQVAEPSDESFIAALAAEMKSKGKN